MLKMGGDHVFTFLAFLASAWHTTFFAIPMSRSYQASILTFCLEKYQNNFAFFAINYFSVHVSGRVLLGVS